MVKLGEARNQQGSFLGKMESLGFDFKNELVLNTLTLEVIKPPELAGNFIETEQVRSLISRRLGVVIASTEELERQETTVDSVYYRWLYTALTRATEQAYLVNFSDEYFDDNL
jgi:hypothetical protein